MGGGSVVRLALYLFGFVLGVTLGSWLAFAIFLNDSTTSLLQRLADSSTNVRRKFVEYSQFVSLNDPSVNINSLDLLRIKIETTQQLKILCVVVYASNDFKRLRAINDTFGIRCSRTIYFSPNFKAKGFDVIIIESDDGYGSWDFFRKMFKRLIDDHSKDNYDWLVHLDDQTYLIYDNLKRFLRNFDSKQALSIGNLHKSLFAEYFLKEAGFVLSNQTLTLLSKFIDTTCTGWWYPSATEYALTKCLHSIGVQPVDGTDSEKGGHRFLPRGPKELFNTDSWSTKWRDPSKCCSDSAVSFGQLSRREFYLLEYMLYKLEPVGAIHVD